MKAQTIKIPQQFQKVWSTIRTKTNYFIKKIAGMDKYEKIVVVWVLLLLVLLIVSPLMIVSPNTTTVSSSYGFLLSLSFLKSFILIVWSLSIVLLRSLHKKTKIFIIERLWFQGNKYFVTVMLLWISLASLIALGETMWLLSDYTTVVQLTTMYYVIQILLIILFAFCLFMIFSSHHHKFKGHVVSYHGKKSQESTTEWWLFESVYHDE